MGWIGSRLRLDETESRRIARQFALLVGLVAASTYLPAFLTGGPTDATPLITAGLCAVVFMWLIRRQALERARVQERLRSVSLELARQHEFLGELSPIERLQDCLDFIVQTTTDRLGCRRVSVMLPDESGVILHIAAACPRRSSRPPGCPSGRG